MFFSLSLPLPPVWIEASCLLKETDEAVSKELARKSNLAEKETNKGKDTSNNWATLHTELAEK